MTPGEIVLATALMAVLLGAIIACCIVDIGRICKRESVRAELEEQLDRLWDDEDDPEWAVVARKGIRRLPEVAKS